MNTTTRDLERTGPQRLRSVGAVVGGLLAVVIPSVATDAVLHATGVYPPPGERMADSLFVIATAYRILFGVLGGWVAARLAPHRPMAHALTMGGIGVLLATAGGIAMWEMGPPWYTLTIIGISLPCAWAGAKLQGAR